MSIIGDIVIPPQVRAVLTILKVAVPVAALVAVVVYVIVLKSELRRETKVADARGAIVIKVVGAVQKGLGPKSKVDENTVVDQIGAAFGNAKALGDALDAQSEKLRIASAAGAAATQQAHAAAQTATQAQRDRAAMSDSLNSKSRSTPLQQAEWDAL